MVVLLRADVVAILTIFVGGYIVRQIALLRRRSAFARGPHRWPILGNALEMPRTYAWLTYSHWAKIYGEIVQLDVFGQPIVILNSTKVAKDLLDKRSLIYSDRPRMVMAGELAGYGEVFVAQPYGDKWRKQRKLVSQHFGQAIISQYSQVQEMETRKLIYSLVQDPSSLVHQARLRIGNIILRLTYGYYASSESDPNLMKAFRAQENFEKAITPGAWLVDVIPQLKYMPIWMPGSGFIWMAAKWRELLWDASWSAYLFAKDGIESGTALMPSLCATALLEMDGKITKDAEETLVWAASTVIGAGLDSNLSTTLTFFLAMVLHPDIQAKARAEIDAVVGQDRLPTIADKASLPYVRSLITEVFRWHPAVPLGIPHALSKEDVYEGIYLPKGSLMIPNVWHMLHDPEVYPNPMAFDPDRYQKLDSEMQKVTDLAFGFGRRACPGLHLAEATVFSIVATVLATCEILPEVDTNGKDIVPEIAYTSGTITFPKPFKYNLKCRSTQAMSMLSQAVAASA
ncbi:hypothetical protein AcV7_007098 [Taiwanofungus camphoratus]|nr:hypothetical protein AcV7_007098 [Antrodia cinnamomea]